MWRGRFGFLGEGELKRETRNSKRKTQNNFFVGGLVIEGGLGGVGGVCAGADAAGSLGGGVWGRAKRGGEGRDVLSAPC